jgi:PBP1b-binding outer membrane lipoprotein LpoB
MKNKLMAYAVLALAAVFISGCASSTDENPTLEAAHKDRTKSSMYAR